MLVPGSPRGQVRGFGCLLRPARPGRSSGSCFASCRRGGRSPRQDRRGHWGTRRFCQALGCPGGAKVVGGDLFRPQWIERALEGVDAIQVSPRATGPCLADFAANALAWAPQIRAGDVVRGAYGRAATSPIHEADIAAVAVEALRGNTPAASVYTLTGPHSPDRHEKVRLIGAAVDRTLFFQDLPAEQVRQGMLAQGLPEEVPSRLLGSLADYSERPGPTTRAVEELLGRPARTFADWAHDNASAFSP